MHGFCFQLKDYEQAKKYMDLAFIHETEPSGVMLEHYGDILYQLGNNMRQLAFGRKLIPLLKVKKPFA